MSGFCKYYKQKKQVSYDNGITWQDVKPYEYQRGELYQSDSSDCGYQYLERWINSGTTCSGTSGYDKYYLQIKQISNDGGQSWITTSDSRLGSLIEINSSDCGYVPIEYRWVDLDPNVDFYCKDSCACYEPIYQWNADLSDYNTFGPYTCYTEYYQVSTDGGNTWENVYPIQKRNNENCVGCGCVSESYDLTCKWYYYIVNTFDVRTPYDRSCDDKDISSAERGINSSTKRFICTNGCLKTIDGGTFANCTNLVSVYFPCSIETLGSSLFNSNKMESITIAAKNPPTISSTTFNNSNNCPIYVYEAFVDKYKAAWPSLASRINPITQ